MHIAHIEEHALPSGLGPTGEGPRVLRHDAPHAPPLAPASLCPVRRIESVAPLTKPKGMSCHAPLPAVYQRHPFQPRWPSAAARQARSPAGAQFGDDFHASTIPIMRRRALPRRAACGMWPISCTYKSAVVLLSFGTRLLASATYSSGARPPRKLSWPPRSRNVTAVSGQWMEAGTFMAQPPLITTAGGTAAPLALQKLGRTTCPPREPKIKQSH
mmetsp:Transcript_63961/g.177451  ORF Transcript_63961/g.177451 Transcript_63961/m.177451 type:complete len:215 (-) Transcript_63961:427-1071(-)